MRESVFDHVHISPMDDIWRYPCDKWAVWERGNRLGERGQAARGFRRLSDAKRWANERFGIVSWRRDEDGTYRPKELA